MVSFKRELCSVTKVLSPQVKTKNSAAALWEKKKANANRNWKVLCIEKNQFTNTLSVLHVLSIVVWSEIPNLKLVIFSENTFLKYIIQGLMQTAAGEYCC